MIGVFGHSRRLLQPDVVWEMSFRSAVKTVFAELRRAAGVQLGAFRNAARARLLDLRCPMLPLVVSEKNNLNVLQ